MLYNRTEHSQGFSICYVDVFFLLGIYRLYLRDALFYNVRICRYNCVFSGTIVEELPADLPRFIKHYQDTTDKSLLLQSINMEKRAFTLGSSL